jgi:2-polyprenyl-3-methyl-5-hydroxy-6-metoxy-1,4-benzoquinol methylase
MGLLEQHLSRYRFAARFAKDARAADVACGAGYGARLLAEAGAAEVFGMDLDPAAVAYAAEHFGDRSITFRAGDAARRADWQGRRFDLIVSLETLEHVRDVAAYFGALDAALAPGGTLVLSASVVPTRDLYAFHLRDYDADSLRREVAAHGFAVVEEFSIEHSFSPREMRRSLRHHPSTVPVSALLRRPLHYLGLATRTYFTTGLRHASLALACRRAGELMQS